MKDNDGKEKPNITGAQDKDAPDITFLILHGQTDVKNYTGTLAAAERIIPGPLAGLTEIEGVACLYIICFEVSGQAKHGALVAVTPKWKLWESRVDPKRPKVEQSTHQIMLVHLSDTFKHRLFSAQDVITSITSLEMLAQINIGADVHCVEVCRELAENVCDGTLSYDVAYNEAATTEWYEHIVYFAKKHARSKNVPEEIELRWGGENKRTIRKP